MKPMDIINIPELKLKDGNKLFTVPSIKGKHGALLLKFANGSMGQAVTKTGTLIHGKSLDENYFANCLQCGQLVEVGEFKDGGGLTGRPVLIKWQPELCKIAEENGMSPLRINLNFKIFWPCLEAMVTKK